MEVAGRGSAGASLCFRRSDRSCQWRESLLLAGNSSVTQKDKSEAIQNDIVCFDDEYMFDDTNHTCFIFTVC